MNIFEVSNKSPGKMDQTQTDTPCENSEKHDEPKDVDDLDLTKDCDLDTSTDNLDNADIIDPLVDLMDSANCKNEYPSDDSDVWNASDSEDETPEKTNVEENRVENISEPVSLSDPPQIVADEDGNKSRESLNANEAEKPESDKELPSELPIESEHEEDKVNEETPKESQTSRSEAGEVCEEENQNKETPREIHSPTTETDGVREEAETDGVREEAETDGVREENKENEDASEEIRTPTSKVNEVDVTKANDEPEAMEPDQETIENEQPDKSDDKTEKDKSEPVESEKNSDVIDLDTTDDTVKDKGSGNEASDVSKMDESTAAEEEEEHQEDKTDKPKSTADSTEVNSEAPEKMSIDDKEETKEKSIENNEEQPEPKDAEVAEESSKPSEDEHEANNEEEEDMEYGDDFDPTLLCPEVEMAVDEEPVITENSARNEDGSSPLPYAPTFETYVDEVTGAEVSLNLTAEEEQLRRRLYGSGANIIQAARLHCTACNVHLGSALKGQNNRFVHPLLKVLICKECYHFYTSGEFEKDEDGSELYCRWCGQGGQVMCCSTCEVVFCKKCIRNNFSRKKLLEIRDSDSWSCFKCQPSQIMRQRVACAEFFEYVRREMTRASTLDDPEFMSRDHSLCCNPNKKAITSPTTSAAAKTTVKEGAGAGGGGAAAVASTSASSATPVDKKRRRKKKIDPDYDPLADKRKDEPGPSTSSKTPTATQGVSVLKPFLEPTPRRIIDGSGNVVSGGASTKTVTSGGSGGPPPLVLNPMRFNFKPFLPMRGSGGMVGQVRPSQPRSTFITVPMQQFRQQPQLTTTTARMLSNSTTQQASKQNNSTTPRQNNYTGTTQQTPRQNIAVSAQPKLQSMLQQPATTMKHDWFEKTVRAAAKVNSHLSYTLTQLNKAQSQAGSIEELAVVHNKLQEILSNSINSLIQIRKNLRAEFIAGIKTVRFPPKKPELNNNPTDDDVIFVSAPPVITVPVVASPVANAQNSSLQKGSSTGTTNASSSGNKDNAGAAASATSSASAGTTNGDASNGKPRPYLKVKSVFELQNVPSECITIPDDPVPAPPPLQSAPKSAAAPVGETPSGSSGKENLCNGDAEEQPKTSEKEGNEKVADKVSKDKNNKDKEVQDEKVCDKDSSDKASQDKDKVAQDKPTEEKKDQDENKNAAIDTTTMVEDKDGQAEKTSESEKKDKDRAKETEDKAIDNENSPDEEMPDADSQKQETNKKEKRTEPPKPADEIVIVDISDDDDDIQPPAKSEKDSHTKQCVVSLNRTDEDISIISDERDGSESPSSKRRRKSRKRRHRESFDFQSFHYNISEDPPPKVKRMMAVKVNLPRVAELEKLLTTI